MSVDSGDGFLPLVSQRRILSILLSIAVLALLSVISYRASGPWANVSTERAKLVLANAFAVSHPDYRIRTDPSKEADVGPWGGTVSLMVDPRSSYPLNKGDEATREVNIELLSSGIVTEPQLRPWYLTSVIHNLSESAPIRPAAADHGLVDLPDKDNHLRALITAKLSGPVPVEDVDAWLLNGIDVAIFRLQNESKMPVSWDASFCDKKSLPCTSDHPISASKGFELWVSALRDEDAPILTKLDLDLLDLRKLAKIGTIEGFIASVELDEIKSLSRNSQIESLQVISVSLGDGRD